MCALRENLVRTAARSSESRGRVHGYPSRVVVSAASESRGRQRGQTAGVAAVLGLSVG